jgi:hypothetical protein
MAEDWQGKERREHARLQLDGEMQGRIHAALEAPVVDLSVSGALLEVPTTLAPDMKYVLKLCLEPGKLLELRSEVVRSYVHGFQNQGGTPAVRYRAALRFVDQTDEQIAALQAFLQERSGGALNAKLTS